jgi:transposase
VLEGIFYVLRTGCRWKAVPREYGCGSSIHRYFQEWLGAGFFDQIWKLGVEKYDELEGISWEWKSVGGSSVRVPVRQELVGQMLIGHRKEEQQGQGL